MDNDVEEFIRHGNSADVESDRLTVKDRLVFAREQVIQTFKKVFPYILVGVGIGAMIHNWIPVAEALLAKGAQLGTILSFMMAVTTLSLPSMIMLRKAVKPRLLGLFVAICSLGIILVGYLFNVFQYLLI